MYRTPHEAQRDIGTMGGGWVDATIHPWFPEAPFDYDEPSGYGGWVIHALDASTHMPAVFTSPDDPQAHKEVN